jgi:hypothetical protein
VKPSTLAPLFMLTGVFHALSVASRFDVVAAQIPESVTAAILFAQLPVLLVEGYFEGRLDYGPGVGPTWMRIKSQPVKVAFTFAFLYLVCVIMQTWNISLGPIDPTPPKEWPTAQRAGWFAMFTAGMFFPNYLAAASSLIPALRTITAPLRKLPAIVALAIASIVGVGAGYGLVIVIGNATVGSKISGVQAMWQSVQENPTIALPLALAMTWVPIIFGLVIDRKKDEKEAAT